MSVTNGFAGLFLALNTFGKRAYVSKMKPLLPIASARLKIASCTGLCTAGVSDTARRSHPYRSSASAQAIPGESRKMAERAFYAAFRPACAWA